VKVRGFRVEPGEVEAALRALPDVLDAAVVARAQALAGYVVPRDGARVDAAALREELARRLPPYLVPSTLTVLDALPRTPSGKLDRRALPEPASTAHSGDEQTFVPPETEEEQAIAAVWAEVLGMERVSATDGFFSLGGHSLRAVRIVNRIYEVLGVRLPVSALFDTPTVRGLAERVVLERERDPGLQESAESAESTEFSRAVSDGPSEARAVVSGGMARWSTRHDPWGCRERERDGSAAGGHPRFFEDTLSSLRSAREQADRST
jgi:acyl carrier protein